MALNFTTSYTFSPNTTIASSQANTNFSDIANVFTGLEAETKTLAKLKVDVDPTTALEVATKQYVDHYSIYRRPNLQYSSSTVVNIETGINGTSGQAQILFPDGNLRLDSTSGRINCNLGQVAALSGSAQSGLRTGSVAVNTRYAVYAVKVTDVSTNFVTVADTVFPIQANFATLNSNFGANSWVFLGYVWAGNGQGGNSAIVDFVQDGAFMLFRGAVSPGVLNTVGIQMATGSATTLTYTYSAGSTVTKIPDTIGNCFWQVSFAAIAGACIAQDSGGSYTLFQWLGSGAINQSASFWSPASLGIKLSNGPASSIGYDIILRGYVDGVLGVGANPLM